MGKNRKEGEGFAVFIPTGPVMTENGPRSSYVSVSSDEEIENAGRTELMERTGARSLVSREIKPDGSLGRRSFYFSGDKWKAPWQPTGPRPNWRTEADPSEPIN